MNTFTQTFDNLLDNVQFMLMSAITKLGPFTVALMPGLFSGYSIYHTFKDAAGNEFALIIAVVVALALETVGIKATHTAVDLYNAMDDKIIQPVKFWLMLLLIPVYVLAVAGLVYFSGNAFTPLVKGLGVASPFLTVIVYIAVALANDLKKIEAKQANVENKQDTLEADERQRQIELQSQERQWQQEKERLEIELKHAEKLARIASKNRPTDRPIDRLTQTLDRSIDYPNLDAKPSNTKNLDELNAKRLADKDAALDIVLAFLDANPDASLNDIGRSIGRSKSTAGNYVDELQQAGKLSRNGHGWQVTL